MDAFVVRSFRPSPAPAPPSPPNAPLAPMASVESLLHEGKVREAALAHPLRPPRRACRPGSGVDEVAGVASGGTRCVRGELASLLGLRYSRPTLFTYTTPVQRLSGTADFFYRLSGSVVRKIVFSFRLGVTAHRSLHPRLPRAPRPPRPRAALSACGAHPAHPAHQAHPPVSLRPKCQRRRAERLAQRQDPRAV